MKKIDLAAVATKQKQFFKIDMLDFMEQPWVKKWLSTNYGDKWVAAMRISCPFKEKFMEISVEVTDNNVAGDQARMCIQFQSPIWNISYMNIFRVPQKPVAEWACNPSVELSTAVIVGQPVEPSFLWQMKDVSHNVQTSGWDPEVFVEDENGIVIPAFHFLPDKAHPKKTTAEHCVGTECEGNVYFDGFQAEFTTRAQSCHGYGMDYVRGGLHKVLVEAQKFNPKAKLSTKNVFEIPNRFLMEATPDQVGLGCMPSLNAYGRESFTIDDPRMLPVRVAGGHIHYGLMSKSDMEKIKKLTPPTIQQRIKAIDRLAGIATVAMFDEVDNPLRREFYGRAGEYRETKYGYEYRVLSNAWLGAPEVAHIVMEMTRSANRLAWFTDEQIGWKINDAKVQEIINYCDVKSARKFVMANWNIWEMIFKERFYSYPEAVPKLKEAIEGGIHAAYPKFGDIEGNWHLKGDWLIHSDNSKSTWGQYSAENPCKLKTLPIVPSALTAVKSTLTQAKRSSAISARA